MPLNRAKFLAFTLVLAASMIGLSPGLAEARPGCSGKSGHCTWEVTQEPDGSYLFWLACAGNPQVYFIDEATACDLCCRQA